MRDDPSERENRQTDPERKKEMASKFILGAICEA